MKTLLPALLLIVVPLPVRGQVVTYTGAAVTGSWYAPALDYYAESEDFRLVFGGAVLTEVQLEFELLGVATLRGGIGHWQKRSRSQVGLNDPVNARRHEGSLRIVPLTASLLVAPSFGRGPRPVAGVGISQNLIQRWFERERISGSTPAESFSGNGRDFSYHGVLGFHLPLRGAFWAGVESRYVWGSYLEERTPRQEVVLDGLLLGLSLRYHIR